MNRRIASVVAGTALLLAGRHEVVALHASQDPLLEATGKQTHAFSLRGLVGLVEGEAGELVYAPEIGPDYKLSELQWDIPGIVMGGVALSAVKGRFGANFGFWTALTGGDGEMKDYDWMVPGMDWTHYSRSEVEIDSAFSFDLNANYSLIRQSSLNARAVIGFKRDVWEWNESGQEYVYSVNGFRDAEGNFEGQNVIDYEQMFDIPYLGLNLSGGAGRFGWTLYALFSPIVFAEDRDHHILREVHFEGEFEGGDFFAAGVSGTWQIGPRLYVIGAAEFQGIPEFRGDMLIVESDELGRDTAGILTEHVSASLGVGIRL